LKLKKAIELLKEDLANGRRVPQKDVVEHAEAEMIKERTLDKAKNILGVKSEKEKGKTDGKWMWFLPEGCK
jgi:hypothetical protein